MDEMYALLESLGYRLRESGLKRTWTHPHTRRAILIMYYDTLRIRLCAEHIGDYVDRVPPALIPMLTHSANCGGSCRPWGGKPCKGGWRFILNGAEYVACRYSAFMFDMRQVDQAEVMELLKLEAEARELPTIN